MVAAGVTGVPKMPSSTGSASVRRRGTLTSPVLDPGLSRREVGRALRYATDRGKLEL
jgi:hypothetical protein